MGESVRVGVILGSTRAGRFCDTVARWTVGQIAANGHFEIEIIDPAKRPEGTEGWSEPSVRARLKQADGFVVVTPEYNHGYPAPLKELIDSFSVEWHAKPVAFVSYGGVSGGLRAVEQLRQVFAELHAVTIRDSVSFPGAWEQFDESGSLRSPERACKAMAALLGRLKWWGIALRNARAAAPYLPAALE